MPDIWGWRGIFNAPRLTASGPGSIFHLLRSLRSLLAAAGQSSEAATCPIAWRLFLPSMRPHRHDERHQ
jgi:hypothetical protein